jgi:hypothetical protein
MPEASAFSLGREEHKATNGAMMGAHADSSLHDVFSDVEHPLDVDKEKYLAK